MDANSKLLYVVAVALVDDSGRILLQKRPPNGSMAGLWEFPGGKMESGEIPEKSLMRELSEELGITVISEHLTPICFASETLGEKHLVLLLYICSKWEGEAEALHASEISWCALQDMYALEMPPADKPLVEALRRWIAS